ncbi:MAG: ChbG/HpnK family deacetylase [Lachnospiraceae bacterium]|nr:ChbG/HpnK family deacetylase [Lachnospiraceae bacterium]MDN4741990.1 ChbG/HpnK family deacetylase [Lachnospiraceae bacterium C1.1]
MIRVIANGDDFGRTAGINRAITESFKRRILTGTTLMVNMPYADEAVSLAREYGFEEAVGLHLNLTSGTPLTDEIKKYSRFCGKNGNFNAEFEQHTISRLCISKGESEALRKEIEAQIQKYYSYGLPARHLDSHHHVHTDRSVMNMLMPLLKKYNFRSVRLSRNLFRKINPAKKVYKEIFNRRLKREIRVTSDYFGSYDDLKAMSAYLKPDCLVELMLHPMYDEKGRLTDSMNLPIEEVEGLLDSLKAERQAYYLV